MKKLLVSLLIATTVFAFAACGSDSQKAPEGQTSAKQEDAQGSAQDDAQDAPAAADTWYFQKDDVKIEMKAPADPLIEALGEYQDSYEAPSCAFDGMDVVYTYAGFEVLTYVENDTAIISGVVLRDDTVETLEGICIGSSKADVEAAYGQKFEEGSTTLELNKGNSQLLIILTDDVVSSIQYLLVEE